MKQTRTLTASADVVVNGGGVMGVSTVGYLVPADNGGPRLRREGRGTYRPLTVDSGLVHICGFSGHGLMMVPAIGEVLRDLCLDREPIVEANAMDTEPVQQVEGQAGTRHCLTHATTYR
ncbi:hypothetical protein ACWDKQ_20035 [Saccharopolyspora sp. NPDC000995]